MAKAWYERSLEKLSTSECQDVQKAASSAFKSIQLAQIIFGESTLDKRRLPTFSSNFVPHFPMKEDGARLIKEMVKARYPDRPPRFLRPGHYRELVAQLWAMIQKETSL